MPHIHRSRRKLLKAINYLYTAKAYSDAMTHYMTDTLDDITLFELLRNPSFFMNVSIYNQFKQKYFPQMNITTYNTYNPNSTLYRTLVEQTIRQNMTTPEQRRQRIYNINYERLQRDARKIRQNKQIPDNTPTTTRINNILNNTTRDLTDQHEKLMNRQIEQLTKEIQKLREEDQPIIKTPNIKENPEVKKLREKHRKEITRHNKRLEKNKDNRVKWMTERLKDKPRKYKVWNYTPNPKTRHHGNDGQKVPIEEKFIIINDKTGDLDYMDYPGDWSASASNTINCLCDITFTDDPKGAEDYPLFKQRKQEEAKTIQKKYEQVKEDREESRRIRTRDEILKELKKKEKEKTKKPKQKVPKTTSRLTYETIRTPRDVAKYYGLKYQKINNEHWFTDEENNTKIIISKFFTIGEGSERIIDNKNKGKNMYDLKEVIKCYDEAPLSLKKAAPKIEFVKTIRGQEDVLGTTKVSTSHVKIYGSSLMKARTESGNLRATLYHEMGHTLDNSVNKDYSHSSKFEKAIEDDYAYQEEHGYTQELSSHYSEFKFKQTGTYSENWAESVSIISQSHLENKEMAVLEDKNGKNIQLEAWKEKHPNVYEYVYSKIYDN